MLIDSTDPCVIAKPNARLIKLLMRAHRFHATLIGSPGLPFAALAKQEGVSRSYFTRLIRLSYLAPDITQAVLDGRQPPHLTADKLLAHSRLPLAWHEQRMLLGLALSAPSGSFAGEKKTRNTPDYINDTAVLEYRPTEITAPVCALSTVVRVSADLNQCTPARNRGLFDL